MLGGVITRLLRSGEAMQLSLCLLRINVLGTNGMQATAYDINDSECFYESTGNTPVRIVSMDDMKFHRPVLVSEVIKHLNVNRTGVYADCTLGQGGHSLALLEASEPDGLVLGIDRDGSSVVEATSRLDVYSERFTGVQGNYKDLASIASQNAFSTFDGILLDLGFSSKQIDSYGYGLSFQRDEYLDMRFDRESDSMTASDIVNTFEETELADLIYLYGEERASRRIARAIVRNRPLYTTKELSEVIRRTVNSQSSIHPATRTFQALRIRVNDELQSLETGLANIISLLSCMGRLAVISYHSLEDRIVKSALFKESSDCICDPGLVECICEHIPQLRLINRRVIKPTSSEIASNPRSRSARLRIAEHI